MDKFDRQQPLTALDTPVAWTAFDRAYVEAVAQRVADLLRDEARESVGRRLVDATTLAAELGVRRSWVYEHAEDLQPVRLGKGSKPRLRFDVLAIQATLAAQNLTEPRTRPSVETAKSPTRAPRRTRDGRRPKPTVGRVLAVRPRDAS